jgi:hypothetical protein
MVSKGHTKAFYLRGIPDDVSKKLKAAAALCGENLPTYIVQLLRKHVEKLERAGQLPRGK